jgi:hypothetical protein
VAQVVESNFVATPLTPDSQFSARLAKGAKGGMVSVLVKLDAEPLASYSGGVPGYPATNPRANGKDKLDLKSPASQRYRAYVNGKQDAFVAKAKQAIPGAVEHQKLDLVFGGVGMMVPRDQVAALSALPGVQAVYPDELLQIETDATPAFIGATNLWNDQAGRSLPARA